MLVYIDQDSSHQSRENILIRYLHIDVVIYVDAKVIEFAKIKEMNM